MELQDSASLVESITAPYAYAGRCALAIPKVTVYANKPESIPITLTLAGIPERAFDYRLGNRSAPEWVSDQYQVKTHARSGILSDPNRPDDPEYIVRLVGQVIQVSLETLRLIDSLPKEFTSG